MSNSSNADRKPQIQKLLDALLSADSQLDKSRAFDIATKLYDQGWGNSSNGNSAHMLPAEAIRPSTYFIMRMSFKGHAATPAEEVAALATVFTAHGSTVLNMSIDETFANIEILTRVDQALNILRSTPNITHSLLATWLAENGYTGNIEKRIEAISTSLKINQSSKGPEHFVLATPSPHNH